jgi:hypothetical protein
MSQKGQKLTCIGDIRDIAPGANAAVGSPADLSENAIAAIVNAF